jgi:hypothetical protein
MSASSSVTLWWADRRSVPAWRRLFQRRRDDPLDRLTADRSHIREQESPPSVQSKNESAGGGDRSVRRDESDDRGGSARSSCPDPYRTAGSAAGERAEACPVRADGVDLPVTLACYTGAERARGGSAMRILTRSGLLSEPIRGTTPRASG